MRPLLLSACVLLLAATPALAADHSDPLARARALYNQGQFDAAVAAADAGRRTAAHADSADLVAARAYLEKFRGSEEADDLARARERLRRINADHFSASERAEFLVGLGEALYFDESPGAAADTLRLAADRIPRARSRGARACARLVGERARPRGAAAARHRTSGHVPADSRSHGERAGRQSRERVRVVLAVRGGAPPG